MLVVLGGNGAGDDSFFATANFSGMTVHDIIADLSGVDHAMTITGTGLGDTITGGDGADTINGGAGDDTLNGEQGADTINGGAGDDDINGMVGADTLTGGAGDDEFIIDGEATSDTITDFTIADDQIDIDVSAINGGNLMDTTGTVVANATALTLVNYTVGSALASNTGDAGLIYVTNVTGIDGFTDVDQAINADNITLDGGGTDFAIGEGILLSFYDADDAQMVLGYIESDTADVFDDGNTFVELVRADMTSLDYGNLTAANFDII